MNNNNNNTEIILKLKGPLLNYKNEAFKDYNELKLTQQQLQQSSPKELQAIAPPSKLGDIISNMMMVHIKPSNGMEAVKLQRWSARINNKMITDKGEMHLDEGQLKELIDIFTKNPVNVVNSSLLGALIYHLEQKQMELTQKLHPNKTEIQNQNS